ncbi:hypothetical protein [Rugosimonospora acidiphila]|uniref:hypothetical protein n=1 Tax=Rugosimonospora acidiphila TaxID=556531 RepID=UPI0031E67390
MTDTAEPVGVAQDRATPDGLTPPPGCADPRILERHTTTMANARVTPWWRTIVV